MFRRIILLCLSWLVADGARAQLEWGVAPGGYLDLSGGGGALVGAVGEDVSRFGSAFSGAVSYHFTPALGLSAGYEHARYPGLDANVRGFFVGLRTAAPRRTLTPYAQWGVHRRRLDDATLYGPAVHLGLHWRLTRSLALAPEVRFAANLGDAPPEAKLHDVTAKLGLRLTLFRVRRQAELVRFYVPDTVYVRERTWMEAHAVSPPPTTYTWTMGDGGEVSGEVIDYVYETPGVYDVGLTVRTPTGEQTARGRVVVLSDTAQGGPRDPARFRTRMLPQITRIYGRRRLAVGEDENFRVRTAYGADWPIEHHWDLGDGTVAVGNNIIHSYREPGLYEVTVESRNAVGIDRDTLYVTVARAAEPPAARLEERPPSAPPAAAAPARADDAATDSEAARAAPLSALRSDEGMQWDRGGFTWLVMTSFDSLEAEALARRLSAEGYRSGVFVDASGPGSTVFRVVLGQFSTERQALQLRDRLPERVRPAATLFALPRTDAP